MEANKAATYRSLELLTADDVARLIGVGTQTLAAWRCRGPIELPFLRIGRLVRYRRQDVEQFLAQRIVNGTCKAVA